MDLKDLTWDYPEPLKDDEWRARRIGEFFPFVADSLTSKDGDTLKVEFTTYPFKSIEGRKKVGRLTVDSLLNMITGELFAMTDRFDPKDFVDLYVAIHRYALDLRDLIPRTEDRFGVKGLNYVIPERLLMVKRVGPRDLPVMLAELDLEQLKAFFVNQSISLGRLGLHS